MKKTPSSTSEEICQPVEEECHPLSTQSSSTMHSKLSEKNDNPKKSSTEPHLSYYNPAASPSSTSPSESSKTHNFKPPTPIDFNPFNQDETQQSVLFLETLSFKLDLASIQHHEHYFIKCLSTLRGSIGHTPQGGIRVINDEHAQTLNDCANYLRSLLPAEVCLALEQRSQMTWVVWVGHLMVWWSTHRLYRSFFHTLAAVCTLHQIQLNVKWNEGRKLDRLILNPPLWPLYVGAFFGLMMGQWVWWLPWPLTGTFGLMIGWFFRKPQWRCGDFHCQKVMSSPLASCPQCGGSFSSK